MKQTYNCNIFPKSFTRSSCSKVFIELASMDAYLKKFLLLIRTFVEKKIIIRSNFFSSHLQHQIKWTQFLPGCVLDSPFFGWLWDYFKNLHVNILVNFLIKKIMPQSQLIQVRSGNLLFTKKVTNSTMASNNFFLLAIKIKFSKLWFLICCKV